MKELDPKGAMLSVATFAPGFLSLGLAGYIADFTLSEFNFSFIAIGMSMLSYAMASFVMSVVGLNSIRVKITVTYASALFIGLFAAYAYERDWILWASGHYFRKNTGDRPFFSVISSIKNSKNPGHAQLWLRVHVKDMGTYEGGLREAPTAFDPDEVYLAPACRIEGEKAIKMLGPGVFISSAMVKAWEPVFVEHSPCAILLNSAEPTLPEVGG